MAGSLLFFKRRAPLVLLILTLGGLIKNSQSFSCYIKAPGGTDNPQTCPTFSKGCTKLETFTANGVVREEKLCGAQELPGYEYKEGCDEISVPFRQRECYCRENLCNGGVSPHLDQWGVAKMLLISGIAFLFKFTFSA
ncbi:hypothetical protein TCAL_08437 [Tigriopus californicus]|uniref:Protein sleepless n=1 Tax=Tigriopus californicus TaxID=6832 RepID=A0A553P2H3_TIGCA|nr:uncharacterized protein LOC131883647 [Tigriopus californicus]TRY71886.1 hypothetical protein TCAL_08437 [Tigriopus californicus]|eukprot:TCALIF_08437-PA protein Name:"Protein of unknown function" AED:0.00 eAED:0.00 QI:65/1/1/1/0.5/0.66/3/125/137